MNPIYSIMESPYRWLILAGITSLAALVGTMAILAYGWSHTFARGWLYTTLVVTVYFLVRAFIFWTSGLESDSENTGKT